MKIYHTKRIMGLAALSFTALSHAGTLFQTGFESTETPGYSTGQISGQNGWSASAVPVAESSIIHSGSGAVAFNSTGLSNRNLVFHLNAVGYPDNTIIFDAHFMESSNGTASNWEGSLKSAALALNTRRGATWNI